jgi:hypothetical protein
VKNELRQGRAAQLSSAVKLGQALEIVRDSLPYCDLELQGEAAAGSST